MEMTSYHYIGIALTVIIVLMVIVQLIPVQQSKKRKKRKRRVEQASPAKDWEKIAQKSEKHNESLKKDIAKQIREDAEKDKQIMVERVRVKKLEEKLTQERQWLKKEGDNAAKKMVDYQETQKALTKTQESYSQEHVQNIKSQKEINELKAELGNLTQRRRELESENMQQKNKMEVYRQDITHLKKDVNELQKKKDDESWVAKSDYQRIEKELKELQKKLERLEREEKKNQA